MLWVSGVLVVTFGPILAWYRFSAAEEFMVIFTVFISFNDLPNFLYRWKIWTAGQFSTRTLLLLSHTVVIAAVCSFALFCWNRRHLEGSMCCSKTFIYLSAFIVPLNCLLNWTMTTRWNVSLLFSVRDFQQEFWKSRSNLDSSDHRTLLHFETIHFKWAFFHRTRRRFWSMFTYGFLFAW